LNEYYVERDTEFIEISMEQILRTLLEQYGYQNAPSEHLRPALDAMYAVSQAHWKAEHDTHETLQRLCDQGYQLGLISNANDAEDVRKLIKIWDLGPYFEVILISADIGIRKPHPRIFEMALKELGVRPERAVMVGDTLGADVLGAQNAGMASVWITRRAAKSANRDHLDTIQPDTTVSTLQELPDLLANWKKS
jgi:putative hydrolase of the HAD superfamily